LRPLLGTLALGLALAADRPGPAEPPPDICVIAPRLEARADGSATGLLISSAPTLVVLEALAEAELRSGARILWRRQSPTGQVLPVPLPWPLPPLWGGERFTLLLRPADQPPGHVAPVQLQAAPPDQLAAHATLVRQLGSSGPAWLAAIDQQLLAGDVAAAWALLFAPEAPAHPELEDLRRQVIAQGCGD
jgi:hypothetical protein